MAESRSVIKPQVDRDRLKVRKELSKNDGYIVDPIFPRGSFHMLVGDSSMGKTTFLLPMLHDWEQGKAVLGGMTSFPCEWVYVSTDRGLQDTNRTLKRLGLEHWNIPAYSTEEICCRDERGALISPSLTHIHEMFPSAKLIVVEGLQGLMPNTSRGQSQNKSETLFMMEVRHQILNAGVTVIATEHIPKGLDTSGARTRRNSPLGSAALIGACGTIISFDYPDTAKTQKGFIDTDDRTLFVSGHNFAPLVLQYTRDPLDGRFILETSTYGQNRFVISHDTPDMANIQIDSQFSKLNPESLVTMAQFQNWGKVYSMSEHSLKQWVKERVANGDLEMLRKGEYRKVGNIIQ